MDQFGNGIKARRARAKTQRWDRGASGLTYGIIVGLIAIGSVAAVDQVGLSVTDLFSEVDSSIDQRGTLADGDGDSVTDTTPPTWQTSAILPAIAKDAPIAEQLTATDNGAGIDPNGYAIVSDPVDALIFSLTPGGLLSGSTSTPGTYSVDVSASDLAGNSTERTFSIQVLGNPPSFTAPTGAKLVLQEGASGATITEFVDDIDDGDGGLDGIASIMLMDNSDPTVLTAADINALGDLTYSTADVGSDTTVTANIVMTDNEGETATASISLTVRDALYAFTTHTFTNCGQTGRTGPSEAQCENDSTGYNVSWDGDDSGEADYFSVSGGIQAWVVPQTGTYRITAVGARGGSSPLDSDNKFGRGASITADIPLVQGETIRILVGQMGSTGGDRNSGGGGGTFVFRNASDTEPLVAAGGGGGGSEGVANSSNLNANTTTNGNDGVSDGSGSPGSGGTNGQGGSGSGYSHQAGAGAGWKSNGGGAHSQCVYTVSPGQSPANGGLGGQGGSDRNSPSNYTAYPGGFGGGGGGSGACTTSGAGGGGGYSGGGVGNGCCGAQGGGGGSYAATTILSSSVTNTGHGSVTIELRSAAD